MACNTGTASVIPGALKGLICNSEDVIKKVMDNLKTGKIDGIQVDEETGAVVLVDKLYTFGAETSNDYSTPTVGSLSSQFVGASPTTYQGTYTSDKQLGLELMVESLVREVLDTIVNNAQVVMKPRMDTFEDDYNKMLVSMGTQAVTLTASAANPASATTPVTLSMMNTALALILTTLSSAGGTIGRTGLTTTARGLEFTDIG